jgi:hypothetical protein
VPPFRHACWTILVLLQVLDLLDDVQPDHPVEAGVLVHRGQFGPEVLLRVVKLTVRSQLSIRP